MRPLRSLWRDRRGVAALEAGITLSVLLIPLLAGMVGVGQALMLQYRLDRATHMGLLYAWGTPTGAATTSNIVNAAQAGYGTASSTSTAPSATITASTACYCLDQTGTRTSSNTTAATCPATGVGTCSSSTQIMGRWVTVSSTASFVPVLLGTWGGATWTLQNTSTIRIQ